MSQNRSFSGGGIKNPLFSNVSQSALMEEFAASNRLIVGVAPPPQPSPLQTAASVGVPSPLGAQPQPLEQQHQQQSTTFTDVPLTSESQPKPPPALPNAGPPPLTGYSRVSPLSRYPRSYIQTTPTSVTGSVNIFPPTIQSAQPKLFTPDSQTLGNHQPDPSTTYHPFPENPQFGPANQTSVFTPNQALSGAFPDSQNSPTPPPQPSLQRALAAAVSKVFTGGSSQPQSPPPAQSTPDPQHSSPPSQSIKDTQPSVDPGKATSHFSPPPPQEELSSHPNLPPRDFLNSESHLSGSNDLPQPAPLTQPSPSLSSFFSTPPTQNPQLNQPFPQPQFSAPPPLASTDPFGTSPAPPSSISQAPSTLSYFEPALPPVIQSAPPIPQLKHNFPSTTLSTPPPPSNLQPAPPQLAPQTGTFSIFTPSQASRDPQNQESFKSILTEPNTNLTPADLSQATSNSSAFANVSSSEAPAPSLPSAASFFAPPPTNRESPFRPIKQAHTPPSSSLNSSPSSIASQQLAREPSASSFFHNIAQPNQTNFFVPSAPQPPISSESSAAILPVSTECLIAPGPAVEIVPNVLNGVPPTAPPFTPFKVPPSTVTPPPQTLAEPVKPPPPVSLTPPPTYASLAFQALESTREVVDGQDFQQIHLENTVPLYNPKTVGLTHPQSKKDESQNLYRVAAGLKRPSYAPPPDLVSNPLVGQDRKLSSDMSSQPQQQGHQRSSIVNQPPQTPPQHEDSTGFSAEAGTNVGHYRPAYHHWFFKRGDGKSQWQPFSVADSLNLEHAFSSSDINENTKVATDGGRYDVEVLKRKKHSVYWEEATGEVRRCSWFVKSQMDSQYVPYDENIAELLEDEFRAGCMRNEWNRRVELADGEVIILHSAHAMAHYQRLTAPDARMNPTQMQINPRIVKRGMEDFEISEGEPTQVDHLVLVVHGIGKVCDLRFRSLVQVVDDFRSISLQLTQSHFRRACESGQVGRVEILPVEWHQALHTETIDKRLADITLPSIPKAREFTNDTILDVLFYSSPVFCEKIVQAVGAELNRVFSLYMERNPSFKGGVSLGGHSLGSLILFDMLIHQKPVLTTQAAPLAMQPDSEDDEFSDMGFKTKARVSRRMSYLKIGSLGAGQPFITYPQLYFHPKAFFAFGSPIGMFLTVRGMESLGDDFKFPTCPKFFNIFHPNDPVAYRIEALISNDMANVPPVLIPHHKGRKRMHLELKETMAHITAALKVKLVESIRSTWNSVYQLAMFQRPDSMLKKEVDQALDDEVMRDQGDALPSPHLSSNQSAAEDAGLDVQVGSLNGGCRIDYVLQEAPLETFNQYISAIRSHLVYWESEDTALLVLKEIYKTMNIPADSQVTHQMVPFDISRGEDQYTEYTDSIGAPPSQFLRK